MSEDSSIKLERNRRFKRGKYRHLIATIGVVGLAAGGFWLFTRQPTLEGKSLNQWLDETTNGFANAARVFAANPEVSVPFLAKATRHREPVKISLIQQLRSAAPFFRRWVPEPASPDTKARAAWLLGQIKPTSPQIVQVLVDALADENRVLKISAASALREIGAPAEPAIPALIGCLGDYQMAPLAEAAITAIHAKLSQQGKHSPLLEQSWPKLHESLTINFTRHHALAIVSLMGSNGAPALPEIRQMLQDTGFSRSYTRRRAILAVEQIGIADPETIALIAAAGKGEQDKSVEKAAQKVLEALGHADAAKPETHQ